MNRIIKNAGGIFVDRRDFNTGDTLCAAGNGDGMTRHDANAGFLCHLDKRTAHLMPQIDDYRFGTTLLQG